MTHPQATARAVTDRSGNITANDGNRPGSDQGSGGRAEGQG